MPSLFSQSSATDDERSKVVVEFVKVLSGDKSRAAAATPDKFSDKKKKSALTLMVVGSVVSTKAERRGLSRRRVRVEVKQIISETARQRPTMKTH